MTQFESRVAVAGMSDGPPAQAFTRRIAYNAAGDMEYEGVAFSGSAASAPMWAIRRYTYVDGNNTLVEWAGGDVKAAHVWDDRESLVYA